MEKFNLHPIQLSSIRVGQLYIKINDASAFDKDNEEIIKGFNLEVAASEFDESNNVIHVRLRTSIGQNEDHSDNENYPINLLVELHGTFSVDTEKFPIKYLERFAMGNAPLIIYPYLREHVMGLTTRAGIPGLILPLFEVPQFKIEPSTK